MPTPKSLHDLRTMRSVRTRPVSEVQAYLEMNRLAGERRRLERELEMGSQKIERIQRRLDEIEEQLQGQMSELGFARHDNHAEVAMPRGRGSKAAAPESEYRQVTLEY
jgi:predicted nuclease with TOPRIM domain